MVRGKCKGYFFQRGEQICLSWLYAILFIPPMKYFKKNLFLGLKGQFISIIQIRRGTYHGINSWLKKFDCGHYVNVLYDAHNLLHFGLHLISNLYPEAEFIFSFPFAQLVTFHLDHSYLRPDEHTKDTIDYYWIRSLLGIPLNQFLSQARRGYI